MENATIQEKLLEEGWNLSAAGLDLVTENGKVTDVKAIIKKLLDTDLRTVSKGTLPEDLSRTKYESIPGGAVLQVQKVKNLSSPKFQELLNSNPNPNILKLVLTDGVQSVQAVPMESISSLHLNTLPGSKIILTGDVEIAHCFLLLTQENTSFIGGKVDHLIDKWELNRKLAKHKRDTQEEGGPPPWVPFGQKITKAIGADKNFKSLDLGKTKELLENTEFEAQRKDAILEASKIGAPKVFGGGNIKLLDHNVQVIVDAGFTVEQAEYALKLAKNNTDRALRSLQNKNKGGRDEGGARGGRGGLEEKSERGGKGKGRGRHRDDDSSALKPSAKVSLFDFLEDKLPLTEKETAAPPVDYRNNNYDRRSSGRGRSFNDRGGDRQKPFEDYRGRREGPGGFANRMDGPGGFANRMDGPERKTHMERKLETIRFDGKKVNSETSRDKGFGGSFKVKNDFAGKSDGVGRGTSRNWNDKRDPKPGQSFKPHSKPEKREEEEVPRLNKSNFIPASEKPPRFQKMANQHNENPPPLWNDSPSALPPSSASASSYPRLPSQQQQVQQQQQQEFHLQNSLANLTLQQTIANFNHSAQDHISVVPQNLNKNMFVGVPASMNDVARAPPTSVPPPQSVAAAYQRRSPAAPAYLQQHEIKAATFPGLPNVPDYPFKTNGTMMQGFNEFQAMFGNAVRTSNNVYNSQPMAFTNSAPNYSNPAANFSTPPPPPNYSNQPSAGQFNPAGNYNNSTPAPSNNLNSYAAPAFMMPGMQQPPPQQAPQQVANAAPQPRRWSWKKGHKCFARYWEDQNYYEALVTGVSENTCVVHFTDYGNYEEVLHDDCFPIDGVPPET